MEDELPHSFSSPNEARRTRVLIDTIVSFSAECRNILFDSLYLDLNINKMSALLFKDLEATKAFVITKDSLLQDQGEETEVKEKDEDES